jgi:prepilin-type N-terminal cleavage/methylation domain-containing protein
MKKARSSGFTIIEVMIVLAVTGLLFLSAAALISGRTNQTEFDQSSRAFQQQIQDSVNEVESGAYTGTLGSSDYSCTPGNPVTFNSGGTTQGTHDGCIFLGDLLAFGLGANQDGENTYTLAGDRLQQSGPGVGEEVTSLSNAGPSVVTLGTGQFDATSSQLEYGLHPYTVNGKSSMNYSLNGGVSLTPIGGFALVYSLASYNGVNIESGSQQVNVVPLVNSYLGEAQATLVGDVASKLPSSPDSASGTLVTICAKSSTTNQYALVTIGGSNNGQLGVTLSILGTSNGTTCP